MQLWLQCVLFYYEYIVSNCRDAMKILILGIVVVLMLVLFAGSREHLYHRIKSTLDNKVSLNARVFTGFWVHKDGPNEEYLSIEYVGQQTLIAIRRMTKWRPVLPALRPGESPTLGPLHQTLVEPPYFRLIPISSTKAQLVSVNPTYAFRATDIEYVDTYNGPAILFQGKTYYETGVTF